MTINRRNVVAGGAALAAAGVATKVLAATHKVTVVARTSQWLPNALTIKAGDTVQWENTAPIPHYVTFDKSKSKNPDMIELPAGVTPFQSPSLKPEATFTYKFTVKGTYKYTCRLHEDMAPPMAGTITVT